MSRWVKLHRTHLDYTVEPRFSVPRTSVTSVTRQWAKKSIFFYFPIFEHLLMKQISIMKPMTMMGVKMLTRMIHREIFMSRPELQLTTFKNLLIDTNNKMIPTRSMQWFFDDFEILPRTKPSKPRNKQSWRNILVLYLFNKERKQKDCIERNFRFPSIKTTTESNEVNDFSLIWPSHDILNRFFWLKIRFVSSKLENLGNFRLSVTFVCNSIIRQRPGPVTDGKSRFHCNTYL